MCKKMFFLLFFVFLVTLVSADMSFGLDPSLVAWWKLDETAGITAFDSSDNGIDGTLQGNPQWVEGKINGALDFDGDGDYVDCGNPDSVFDITGELSVSTWVNIRSLPTGWSPAVVKGENAWRISTNNTQTSFHFGINYWETANYAVFGSIEVDMNEWHHICGTFDGTTIALYVDGVADGTVVNDIGIGVSTTNLWIGGNPEVTYEQRNWDGLIDEVGIFSRALTAAQVQRVMQGLENPALSAQPYPPDAVDDVSRDVILHWTPGRYAHSHNVYFGTDFNNVNDADASSPLLLGPSLTTNSFNPSRLEFSQTYFWRIDEVNAPPDSAVFKGDIWSFTVEPIAYPIPVDKIIATASGHSTGQGPKKTIDGSGLDENDLHSVDTTDMWLSSAGDLGSAWIQYEFDKPYKLHEMLIWNYNGDSILSLYGIKEVTIEYSSDGATWMLANVSELNQASGEEDYAANTTVPFDGVEVKYVKVTANNNWMGGTGIFNKYGLSEVRFMYIPVSARNPVPENEATGVAIDTSLSWRPGREAAEHKVYLSTDQQAVIDGTAFVATDDQPANGPLSLDLSTIYYWRVDEVNNAETPITWPGSIWSFTTQDYLVVDDFESYNDIPTGEDGSNLVYETWIDGYGNPSTNGSTIGYASGESMETNTVHGGRQSVPLSYDNTSASLSEVTVDPGKLPIGRNWSKGSPQALALWIYGDPNNTATEQMYVTVNGVKTVISDVDLTLAAWQEVTVDLAAFNTNLGNVSTFAISIERTGATGGSGMVFIDDIRLYLPLLQ
jgi:hypothetical protein